MLHLAQEACFATTSELDLCQWVHEATDRRAHQTAARIGSVIRWRGVVNEETLVDLAEMSCAKCCSWVKTRFLVLRA